LLHGRFDAAEFLSDLEARHKAWERSGQADEESLFDTLRRAHHAEVFRTLVRDVEGHITVEQVADDLSALADATLDCVVRWSWQHLKQRHRDTPRFGIVAYGKLGGKELGYGSDLDVVFLYDDDDERSGEVYGAFVRKLINWLTLRTAAGELFDIDTACGPTATRGSWSPRCKLRELPDRARQQHRLDLGTPGADTRRVFAPAWPRSARVSRRCGARCCARRATPIRCAPRCRRCARRCVRRGR
jgi:hypothetical protein